MGQQPGISHGAIRNVLALYNPEYLSYREVAAQITVARTRDGLAVRRAEDDVVDDFDVEIDVG